MVMENYGDGQRNLRQSTQKALSELKRLFLIACARSGRMAYLPLPPAFTACLIGLMRKDEFY